MRPGLLGLFVLLGAAAEASAGPSLVEICRDPRYTESSSACFQLARQASSPEVARDLMMTSARRDLWACDENLTGPRCRQAVGTLFEQATEPADVTQAVAILQRMCVDTDEVGCRHVSTAFWYGRGVPVDAVASARWHRRCTACDGAFDPEGLVRDLPEPWAAAPSDEGRRERVDALIAAREYEAAAAVSAAWPARAEIEAMILDTRWRAEVEPLRAQGKLIAAIGTGRRIPGAAPRLAGLEAELAAPHLRWMEEARARRLPLAARFHALVAALFDKNVTVPPEPTTDLAALPTRFTFTWAGDSCVNLRFVLADRYPSRDANVEVQAALTCSVRSTSREVRETRIVGRERIEHKRTREVPGECSTVQTPCMAELMGKGCYTTRCSTKTEHYTEYEDVPIEETKMVTHYDTHVTVSGTITSRFGTAPVEHTQSGDVAPAVAELGAEREIGWTIDAWRRSVVKEAIDKELALARRATGLAAEEHLLRAFTLGAPADPLAPASGLDVGQVTSLLRAGTIDLPYVAAPGPTDGEPELIALAAFDPAPTLHAEPPDRGPRWPERVRLPRQLAIVGDVVLWKDRDENTQPGGGARLELASSLERTGDVVLRVSAAAFTVDGKVLDGRLAIGTGLRRGALAIVAEVGGGVQSLPVMDAQRIELDGGWSVAVAHRRATGFGASFRYEALYGGALDTETRWTLEVARRSARGSAIGAELWRHRWEEAQETLFGVGLCYRAR